jgi:hypothetical protein
MTTTYDDFIARRTQLDHMDGVNPGDLPDFLFPFQRDLVGWAIRKGRAAIFLDLGAFATESVVA